ncbi:uncharacterized protein ARMOST_09310 [Armillaria ostoyae]|nr:uncharacterized protein ARMOST_09310 [Armillaria ostoyae]
MSSCNFSRIISWDATTIIGLVTIISGPKARRIKEKSSRQDSSHLFFDYVGRPSVTGGPSMLPTLAIDGDWVLEDRLSLRFTELSRGDLVTAKSPLDPLRIVCKRIIGLPGDIICVDPTGQTAASTEHVVVPSGHVWLSGDNFSYSRDSRTYGPVPIALIQGKVRAKASLSIIGRFLFIMLHMQIKPLRGFTIYHNPVTYLD